MRRFALSAGLLLLVGSLAVAQDATTEPASQPATIDGSDTVAATAAEGKQVVVEGTITKAAWSKSGKTLQAHFAKGKDSLVLVIFSKNKDAMNKAFGGDVATALNGATVRATGEIKAYHDRPELIVDTADQLTITAPAATEPATQQ